MRKPRSIERKTDPTSLESESVFAVDPKYVTGCAIVSNSGGEEGTPSLAVAMIASQITPIASADGRDSDAAPRTRNTCSELRKCAARIRQFGAKARSGIRPYRLLHEIIETLAAALAPAGRYRCGLASGRTGLLVIFLPRESFEVAQETVAGRREGVVSNGLYARPALAQQFLPKT